MTTKTEMVQAFRSLNARRTTDREFLIAISVFFVLVFLVGVSFGHYLGAEKCRQIFTDNALDTRGAPASHRAPDVEK